MVVREWSCVEGASSEVDIDWSCVEGARSEVDIDWSCVEGARSEVVGRNGVECLRCEESRVQCTGCGGGEIISFG